MCVSVRACVYACACVSVNIVRLVGDPDLGGGCGKFLFDKTEPGISRNND